ncbi:NAD(P)/FAD-dependent oxidoreductase [Novosphingobium malaysiense]|uniref:NAD(P)/FAD-dependent oxidoreductase n=1 Tax=Novosphingobium malaysiense TaxID=1348853 RepID=UPI00068FA732|nr:hypothetical protein [Novosphingobium malaysiense]
MIARDPVFCARVARWKRDGLLARWWSGPTGALVGTPAMSSLVEASSLRLDVRFASQVQRLYADAKGWRVAGDGFDEGSFDAALVAAPAEQAAALLSLHDLALAREAAAVRSIACWSVMVAFAEPVEWEPAFLRDCPPIAWAARNNTKPGRPDGECWVIQANPHWSRTNIEREATDVSGQLLAAFGHVTGASLPATTFLKAHRWRYAHPRSEQEILPWNASLRLGACGDWCHAPTIEGAWLSGNALAETVAGTLLGIEREDPLESIS